MPLAIHLLNKPDETGRPRRLETVVKGVSFKTCCWKLSAREAASIIGGWIYLHDKKANGAFVGGLITAIEPATEPGFADRGRYAITFTSRLEAKRMPWRGALHGMAWTSGVIKGSAVHEADLPGPT